MDGYVDIKSVTTTYSTTAGDSVVLADPTGGAFTVTLKNPTLTLGKIITIKKVDAGGNAITVDSDGGNIDGLATQSLSTAYAKGRYVSDGVNYWSI